MLENDEKIQDFKCFFKYLCKTWDPVCMKSESYNFALTINITKRSNWCFSLGEFSLSV